MHIICGYFYSVLQILKSNFTRLCHCLSQDYEKTIDKLAQLMPEIPAEYLNLLKTFPSTELINESIIGNLIGPMEDETHILTFCDIMAVLSDEISAKNFLNSLRNRMYNNVNFYCIEIQLNCKLCKSLYIICICIMHNYVVSVRTGCVYITLGSSIYTKTAKL